MTTRIASLLIIASLLTIACSNKKIFSGDNEKMARSSKGLKLVDRHATAETKALFDNLMQLSKEHTLFGHQHATEYGHGWSGDSDRSDVKSVTGSHPAVIGVDFSGFTGRPAEAVQKAKAD